MSRPCGAARSVRGNREHVRAYAMAVPASAGTGVSGRAPLRSAPTDQDDHGDHPVVITSITVITAEAMTRWPTLERWAHAARRIVLLADEGGIDGAAVQAVNDAVGAAPLDPIELLVLQVLQARHEREPEQVAQARGLLGEAVRVGVVLAGAEQRVVVEQAVEHVDGFARRAGDRVAGGQPFSSL
jgi:hypothetical protein